MNAFTLFIFLYCIEEETMRREEKRREEKRREGKRRETVVDWSLSQES
jgi:hypothetical protein